MAMRAWRIWGISAIAAGSVIAADSPTNPIEGRATPVIIQDFNQPEIAPPPRLLPPQILNPRPAQPGAPTATEVQTASIHFDATETVADRKGRMALQIADMFYDACDLPEARSWYQEVIKLAPGTKWSASAAMKLEQAAVIPAGQTVEPPLANAIPIP
jgi:hypothetical protein